MDNLKITPNKSVTLLIIIPVNFLWWVVGFSLTSSMKEKSQKFSFLNSTKILSK